MKLKSAAFLFMLGIGLFDAHGADVQELIGQVKSEYSLDARVSVWDVSASSDEICILSGETDNVAAKDALLLKLERNGIRFKDEIVVLPDSTVDKPWALVSISVACIRNEARSGAELASQAIMGTPVRVLKKEGGMTRIQTPDNYIGYVTDSSLKFLSAEEMDAWRREERRVVVAYQCPLFEKADGNESAVVSDLVQGNILKYKGKKGGYVWLELPDGREGYARKTDVADFDDWVKQDFDVQLIERNARRMLGSPYLWGGMSTKMADCSGFVKTAYFSNGIILRRDASQQALTGQKVDWKRWRTDAEPGDLIFIGTKSGKVTHVAMYLGGGKYIHSSGYVKINSMDSEASDYLDYTFLSMSRVKGTVGTDGIVAVGSHPWYVSQQ